MRNERMKSVSKVMAAIATCVSLGMTAEAADETMYVQSLKASVKAAPAMNAPEVASLSRGAEVRVTETKGVWLKVDVGGKQAWISKLFVNKTKPIGQAALAQEVPASEAKTSRRRESSYAVSAATRGLVAMDDRARDGRERYRSNNQAVDTLEGLTIEPAELEQFQKSGKLLGH